VVSPLDRRPAVSRAAAAVSRAGGPRWRSSLGCSKVAGIGRIRQRLIGQMMTKARPITAFSGIVPPPGWPRWFLASSEMSLWSP